MIPELYTMKRWREVKINWRDRRGSFVNPIWWIVGGIYVLIIAWKKRK